MKSWKKCQLCRLLARRNCCFLRYRSHWIESRRGVLPCMAYTGVCSWTGAFFLSVLNRIYNFAQVCPKQYTWFVRVFSSNKIEGVVLNRVCILRIFCPKQGQGFKPSAAYLHPKIGRVPPNPPPPDRKVASVIFWIGIRPVDSAIQLLSNRGLVSKPL